VIIHEQNAYTHNANLIDWVLVFGKKHAPALSQKKWGETRGQIAVAKLKQATCQQIGTG
jgi:hypothetical protein